MPRNRDRYMYIGFERDCLHLPLTTSYQIYPDLNDIPPGEPEPDFLWIHGSIDDSQIAALMEKQEWKPFMLRVVGRSGSRVQRFLNIPLTTATVLAIIIVVTATIVVPCILAFDLFWNTPPLPGR